MPFMKNHKRIWYKLKIKRWQQKEISKQIIISQRKEDFRNLDTFHSAMRPCMLLAHIFGVMPLVNSLGFNPYRVRFHIRCVAFIMTCLFFLFGGMKTLHFTGRMFATGINPKNIISIVFVYMCSAVCLAFLNLARRWPALIRYWTRIDLIFLQPPFRPPKWSLRRQIHTFTIIFWIIALVETSTYQASSYYNFRMKRLHCHSNDTHHTFKDFIIMQEYKDVFDYFPFNFALASYAYYLSTAFTFMWNFMDFFIIVVSLGLSTRFQQFAERIELLSGCYVPDNLWNQIRRQHVMLCEFMESVNEHVSTIVFMSCINDMYFIANQLLNIFTKLRYPINYVYFWTSLIFLLARTSCMFMFASKIHDASLSPLKTLYLVPSGCWTEEVQRFMAQILNEAIGLTGKRFFLLTRSSLFGMMATLITYEFMLLQLDAKNREAVLPDLCA